MRLEPHRTLDKQGLIYTLLWQREQVLVLRSKGITTIALGGFLTNCCVESTMRSGYENGYHVITLSDCLAATSAEEHENALKYDYPMFSEPMASVDFVAELARA